MADMSLCRPPFTPPDTFLCCVCFELVSVADAYVDQVGTRWDMCESCGENERVALVFMFMARRLP